MSGEGSSRQRVPNPNHLSEGRTDRNVRLDHELGTRLAKLPFYRAMDEMTAPSHFMAGPSRSTPHIFKSVVDFCIGGLDVEETAEMMDAAVKQLKEARSELEKTSNRIHALHDEVFPKLVSYVQEIRSMRMAATTEMTSILNEMKQVHKFFIEASYEREMGELERFVGLCKEIQRLKNDGVFDAVCDSIIRLAIKEPSK